MPSFKLHCYLNIKVLYSSQCLKNIIYKLLCTNYSSDMNGWACWPGADFRKAFYSTRNTGNHERCHSQLNISKNADYAIRVAAICSKTTVSCQELNFSCVRAPHRAPMGTWIVTPSMRRLFDSPMREDELPFLPPSPYRRCWRRHLLGVCLARMVSALEDRLLGHLQHERN